MPFNIPKQFTLFIALMLGIYFGMQGQSAAAGLNPAGVGFLALFFALVLIIVVARTRAQR